MKKLVDYFLESGGGRPLAYCRGQKLSSVSRTTINNTKDANPQEPVGDEVAESLSSGIMLVETLFFGGWRVHRGFLNNNKEFIR